MPDSSKRCRIAEVLQYDCTVKEGEKGPTCFPFPRVFRLCPGKPVVEITAFVDVDMNTGEVTVPDNVGDIWPKTRPFRDFRTSF